MFGKFGGTEDKVEYDTHSPSENSSGGSGSSNNTNYDSSEIDTISNDTFSDVSDCLTGDSYDDCGGDDGGDD